MRTPSPQRGEGWGEGVPTERSEPPHPGPLANGERGTSSYRQDEQAREAQQHLAVVARLIGADDLFGIGGEKFFAVGGVERRQERLQRRALEPFGDRFR